MIAKYKKGDIVSFDKLGKVLIVEIYSEETEPKYKFLDLQTGRTSMWFARNIDNYIRLLA